MKRTPESGVDSDDPRRRAATPRHELWLYFWAALSYIICGFAVKQIFAWWWFGAAWFVLFVWLVPAAADRIRPHRADQSDLTLSDRA